MKLNHKRTRKIDKILHKNKDNGTKSNEFRALPRKPAILQEHRQVEVGLAMLNQLSELVLREKLTQKTNKEIKKRKWQRQRSHFPMESETRE